MESLSPICGKYLLYVTTYFCFVALCEPNRAKKYSPNIPFIRYMTLIMK